MNPRRTVITGALGHLGWTYLCHMARTAERQCIHALDIRAPDDRQRAEAAALCAANPARPELVFDVADLTRPDGEGWGARIGEADSVVHLAAVNPFPSANWAEATASMDITANVALAAAASGTLRRFVFASSNHVMGGYKQPPLADTIAAGELSAALPPALGTVERNADGSILMDSTIYAVPKLMGERLCDALARSGQTTATFVSIRIGCCKPGWSGPREIPAAYARREDSAERRRDQRWAEDLWLSADDFRQLVDKAQTADAGAWPAPAVVVNGMSRNSGMKWSLDEAARYLDFRPADDIRDHLPA